MAGDVVIGGGPVLKVADEAFAPGGGHVGGEAVEQAGGGDRGGGGNVVSLVVAVVGQEHPREDGREVHQARQ